MIDIFPLYVYNETARRIIWLPPGRARENRQEREAYEMLADIIIVLLVGGAVVAVLIRKGKELKAGKTGCSGCSGCSACKGGCTGCSGCAGYDRK